MRELRPRSLAGPGGQTDLAARTTQPPETLLRAVAERLPRTARTSEPRREHSGAPSGSIELVEESGPRYRHPKPLDFWSAFRVFVVVSSACLLVWAAVDSQWQAAGLIAGITLVNLLYSYAASQDWRPRVRLELSPEERRHRPPDPRRLGHRVAEAATLWVALVLVVGDLLFPASRAATLIVAVAGVAGAIVVGLLRLRRRR